MVGLASLLYVGSVIVYSYYVIILPGEGVLERKSDPTQERSDWNVIVEAVLPMNIRFMGTLPHAQFAIRT